MNKIMKRFTAGTLLCTLLAYTSPVLAYTKDETVYSKINGNGNRTKTIRRKSSWNYKTEIGRAHV